MTRPLGLALATVAMLGGLPTSPPEVEARSGLEGITRSIVMSAAIVGRATAGPASLEFAIAPLQGDTPVYDQAVFVASDSHGRYRVALRPGRYWIGAKAKALDPARYRPVTAVFEEQKVTVKPGAFTQLDLLETSYPP